MASGILVYNQTGQVQVTEEYKNLKFLRKGAISSFNQFGEYSISFSTSEVVAFRTPDGGTFAMDCEGVRVSGGTQTFEGSTVNGATIYYYVFGYAAPTSGNFFEVRNGNGEVIFSDADTPMKVFDFRHSESSPVWSDSLPAWGGNSMVILDDFTYPTNKTIAVVPSFSAVDNYSFLMNNFGYTVAANFFYFRSGRITHFYDYYYSWDHGAQNAGHKYLAIDVTGL